MTATVAFDQTHFRDVMGRFCTGVTLITSHDQHGPMGFACQSLQSLSMDPPMVSFAPAKTSTSWPRIRETGRFAVNVLAADQLSLCMQFAKSGADKFGEVSWSRSPLGSPIIDGAHAWIDCTITTEVDAGDHTLVLGTVNGLDTHHASSPLVYYRGTFHSLQPASTH